MFEEKFVFDANDDDPAGEYKSDDLSCYYYLEHISDGYEELCKLITHEWLHGMLDWATEGEQDDRYMVTPEKDHYIMKIINFN